MHVQKHPRLFRLAVFLLLMIVYAVFLSIVEWVQLGVSGRMVGYTPASSFSLLGVEFSVNLLVCLVLGSALGGAYFLLGEALGLAWRLERALRLLWNGASPADARRRAAHYWAWLFGLGGIAAGTFALALYSQKKFHSPEAISALLGGGALALYLATRLLTRLLAWLLSRLFDAIERSFPFLHGFLTMRLALPLSAAVGVMALLGVIGWKAEMLKGYDLRLVTYGLFTAAALPFGMALARSGLAVSLFPRRVGRWVAGIAVVLLIATQALALHVMDDDMAVRETTMNDTAYTANVIAALQWTVDFDRDGFSPIYGGGDCDDFNADVNPDAEEIPDNGIDDNCLGGDYHEKPAAPVRPLVPAKPAVAKNILVIVVDALRGDMVSFNGSKQDTTPELKRIARERCTNFHWAYSPASKTAWSVGPMLYGKRASLMQWETTGAPIPEVAESELSVGEVLHARGYDADSFLLPAYYEKYMTSYFQGFTFHGFSEWATDEFKADEQLDSSHIYTDRLIKFLEERTPDSPPFIVYTQYFDPHAYYVPAKGFDKFGNDNTGRYQGEILYTDKHVGRLLDWMRDHGWLDNTVVVFTADHGEGLGQHDAWTHGQNLYTELTHVPLLVCEPGQRPREVNQPVSTANLAPTLLDLVGVPAPPSYTATSFRPLIEGDPLPPAPIITEIMPDNDSNRRMTAVLKDDWKLIYNHISRSFQLFDLKKDPTEDRNLFPMPLAEAKRRELMPILLDVVDGASVARTKRRRQYLVAATPREMVKLDVRFEGGLALLGYTIDKTRIKRNEEQGITLYWQATTRLPRPFNYRVFVHVNPTGRDRTLKADHQPADGNAPFDQLRRGEILKDRFSFPIPADWPYGQSEVWLGLFDADRLDFTFGGPELENKKRRIHAINFNVAAPLSATVPVSPVMPAPKGGSAPADPVPGGAKALPMTPKPPISGKMMMQVPMPFRKNIQMKPTSVVPAPKEP